MAKAKAPLHSLSARGGLGDVLSFARRMKLNIVEKKPVPYDAKSPAQLTWRHMFNKVVSLWHALSASEKQEWDAFARPFHMTGYAYFISQSLRPNPGIYLPLQGGTMAGDIDMAKFRILRLPAPIDPQEPMRLADGVGVHGADKHTDVTRDLFISATSGHVLAGIRTTAEFYAAVSGTANADAPKVSVTFKVPSDFVAFLSYKAVWVCAAATGDMYWRMRANYAHQGEAFTTHTEDPGHGVTSTGGVFILNVQEPLFPLTLPNIAKEDYVGVYFERWGTMAEDTLNQAVYLGGFLFTYTAEQ